jgi:hypothetical protein
VIDPLPEFHAAVLLPGWKTTDARPEEPGFTLA